MSRYASLMSLSRYETNAGAKDEARKNESGERARLKLPEETHHVAFALRPRKSRIRLRKKNLFSVVLLARVDFRLKSMIVDVEPDLTLFLLRTADGKRFVYVCVRACACMLDTTDKVNKIMI